MGSDIFAGDDLIEKLHSCGDGGSEFCGQQQRDDHACDDVCDHRRIRMARVEVGENDDSEFVIGIAGDDACEALPGAAVLNPLVMILVADGPCESIASRKLRRKGRNGAEYSTRMKIMELRIERAARFI